MRTFFLTLIIAVALPAPARAELEVPQFNHGGFLFSIQWGIGVWHYDTDAVSKDLGFIGPLAAPSLSSQLQNTHGLGFRLGYNIKGHVTIGADFTATGWNVFNAQRGGSGAVVGVVAWHPMELFFLQKEKRPFGLDASTYVGVGYGILG